MYGHANGETVDEALAEVARYVGLGYRAVRVQTGVPGLATTYGVGEDRMFYEPADAAVPTEAVWSTERYLDHVPSVFARVRDGVRPDAAAAARRAPPAHARSRRPGSARAWSRTR